MKLNLLTGRVDGDIIAPPGFGDDRFAAMQDDLYEDDNNGALREVHADAPDRQRPCTGDQVEAFVLTRPTIEDVWWNTP